MTTDVIPDKLSNEIGALFARGPAVVLTGAGVSTDSGVPGYRDEAGAWLGATPMQFGDFEGSSEARQRYWARSFAGYSRMASAAPNRAHTALRELERRAHVLLLVTQNVDGLHERAGSTRVLELHGSLSRVVCTHCNHQTTRRELQTRLTELNPGWKATPGALRPDGDLELGTYDYATFNVAGCPECGGVLKPDVVFFGERVPVERHLQANAAIAEAALLLVVGSSLMVNSGFRLVRTAEQHNVPIVVFNRGKTRADGAATLKLDGNAGELLETLLMRLPPA